VSISVAGGLPIGVGYVLDGASHNSPQSNVNLPMPFPDALQEFRVATSGLTAQNGMHAAASVNAITKSGTNTLHGKRLRVPARPAAQTRRVRFAAIGPDGKRQDDGLLRNQFGGTLGGPIARDRLFFFGGYQGTVLRFRPADQLAWVPTPAMLAGDFTTFASAACNGGRQVTLRAPFANNRVDPSQFSPAALNLAKRLPPTPTRAARSRIRRGTTATRSGHRTDRLPVERRPYGVRPLHERVHQEDAALQGRGRQRAQGDPTTGFGSGPRQHGPHADARRHDGVRAHRRELDSGSRTTRPRCGGSTRRTSIRPTSASRCIRTFEVRCRSR